MSARITGVNAGKIFSYESGKHVVQRVPPTESNGRRQTSTVCVTIIPFIIYKSFSNRTQIQEESKVITQGGHGPGGQHQNKRDSAVRMVHQPTGIQVFINGRSQHQNREMALDVLCAKINQKLADERESKDRAFVLSQLGGGSRGNKIRTYNFIKSLAVDHRYNKKTRQLKEIMKGRFELLRPE